MILTETVAKRKPALLPDFQGPEETDFMGKKRKPFFGLDETPAFPPTSSCCQSACLISPALPNN
jgi:hypothetical protein